MKVHTRAIAVLAILLTTSLACLAVDQKTEAKADTKRQTVQIQADKIEYNAETKEITASGNVVITNKDGSTVKGEKVVIKADDNATVVSGGAKIEVKPDGKK
jgi:lipopolysaccharide export system protein LptA